MTAFNIINGDYPEHALNQSRVLKKTNIMKLFVLIFISNLSLIAFAQDGGHPVPDYLNTPYLYDSINKDLIELDANIWVMGSKPKGFTKSVKAIYIDGSTSSNKIEKNNAVFIVKLKDGLDPRTLMDLNLATSNIGKDRREYIVFTQGMYGNTQNNSIIQLSFDKIDNGVYIVSPKKELESGEYFFSLKENTDSKIVYSFTIK